MREQDPEDGREQGTADPSQQVGDIEPVRKLNPRPHVWIGSWSDYNNGILHGRWIDAARDEADVEADIRAMLADSPTARQSGETAEEWGIFDYDGFGALRVGERDAVSWVTKVARGTAEHGPAFAAYASVVEDEDALANFSDDYLGHYDSVAAYVSELVDDLGFEAMVDQAVPEALRPYVHIDVAGLARDMELAGDINWFDAEGGGVWLFR